MNIQYEDIKSQLNADNVVGSGGYGTVYRIVINKINYAVKQINLKNLTDNEILVMENEAKNLIKINHKNIVKYYNLYKNKDSLFILMEYCPNKDLLEFIELKKKNNSSFDNLVIFSIVSDICEGLIEIHKNNLIHRDLKPENIFISKDYTFKIGDFDFVKRLNGSKNIKATSQKGTINYMAPEMIKPQNNNNKYSNKIDIWALGCIIYELCNLDKSFDCESIIELFNKIENSNYKDLKNNDWKTIVDKLLNKNPDKRPDINKAYNKIIKLGEKYKDLIFSEEHLNSLDDEEYLNSLDEFSKNIIKKFKSKMKKRSSDSSQNVIFLIISFILLLILCCFNNNKKHKNKK